MTSKLSTIQGKALLIVLCAAILFVFSGSTAFAGPLDDPSDLVATAVSSSQIDLTWTDNSKKEDGFEIERSTDGSNFSLIDTVGQNVESYSDTGLSANTLYYYRVRAFDEKPHSTSYSGYSNVDSDTTFDVPPAAPSALGTSVSDDDVTLDWTDNADNEDGFKIERSLDGVDFSQIDTVGENITTYDDLNLDDDDYYYRVRAYNAVGDSSYSNVATATVFTLQPPAAPSNLNAAASSTGIFVWWVDNADNEDNFEIERGTNGIDFSFLTTTSVNISWYTDTSVATSTTYYYRVRATNTAGNSSYSNTASSTSM